MRFLSHCGVLLKRKLLPGLLIGVVIVTASGCFKKGPRGDYALPPAQRPLEVPPDFVLPDKRNNTAAPALASVVQASTPPPSSASSAAEVTAAPASTASSFKVVGNREAVYTALGPALAGISGVTISSRSQMLASYDISFEDSRFLVRVVAGEENEAQIAAVDARGLPVTDAAALRLMAQLKTRLSE